MMMIAIMIYFRMRYFLDAGGAEDAGFLIFLPFDMLQISAFEKKTGMLIN